MEDMDKSTGVNRKRGEIMEEDLKKKVQEGEKTPQECEIELPRLVECEILTVSVRMLCVHKLDITCQICLSAAKT